MSNLRTGLAGIRREMDRFVVGHDDIKEAILLGVISREHIYLEGPPGTAKTMLAELAAQSANLRFYFYQLHRDTRLAELIGDIVISREKAQDGELIKQSVRRGGVLTAEICVLDDISRAPGEALNVLLRILNERKFGEEDIPLLTAIATSNPVKDDYYNEPLDPANLDRFTIQMRTVGLIQRSYWDEAMKVVNLYADDHLEDHAAAIVSHETLDRAYYALRSVEIPAGVKEALLTFVERLLTEFKLDDSNSLVTDRTFLVKALKILKAKAVLEGRDEVGLTDLRVLKYMTTFRVPPEVHEQIDDLIDDVIDKKKIEVDDLVPDTSPDAEEDSSIEQVYGEPTDEVAEEVEEESKVEEKTQSHHQIKELIEADTDGEDLYVVQETVENIELLLKEIKGHVERSIAEQVQNYGGQPRRWKQMVTLDEIIDSDHAESMVWSDNISPQLPRVYRRERKVTGGELAILRDVSSSMMGRYAKWCSAVIVGLIEMAQQKRMRVGYIEFNHQSVKYKDRGRFFTRDFEKLSRLACNVKCSGYTNYERSLNDALAEFGSRQGMRNKHVVFLTDGVPTQGDWEVKEARALAKKLGVSIHTIFIGNNECPKILDIISDETTGTQFQASTDYRGVVTISERSRPIRRSTPPERSGGTAGGDPFSAWRREGQQQPWSR